MLRNGLEPGHLLVLAIVVIVLFGSRKLPDTARALGRSMRILKSETKAMREDDTARTSAASTTTASAAPEPARAVRSAPGGAPDTVRTTPEREPANPNVR
ncbi:Sec-independent protein translocase subunit TatA [Embleya hyalina]|uniref:Sec-independent protein translocase protein TatA n=1 Tax=Embleya hyalina TaxID=516124 RepID=A0A401YKH1_9ACTN|nr:Sec-independent protein translocase subunit TatA [Embleya hyalina]GCD95029.1 Sec-independent protein translocase protein TatA [Embleya hyalina]